MLTPTVPRSMPRPALAEIELPRIVTEAPLPVTATPGPALLAMVFAAPAAVPPMTTPGVSSTLMPAPPLGKAVVPLAPTPMVLPVIVCPPAAERNRLPSAARFGGLVNSMMAGFRTAGLSSSQRALV
jgi:hypothetical protein